MDPAVVRTCAALLLFSFSAFPQQPNQSDSPKPPTEHVWLAVEEQPRGQLRVEPIATVEKNTLVPIQTSCLSDVQTPEDFSAPYLQPGAKYSILFGGANLGEGTLAQQNTAEHTARLDYAGPIKIRGQARALATNAGAYDFRVASRESAKAEERAAALALARKLFAQHGMPETLLAKIRAEHVARTYLAPSAQPSFIASFFLDEDSPDGLVHGLFFIASQPAERLEPEFVWIHLSEAESGEERLRFVDHADLFDTGEDEVVGKLVSVQTQSHRYLIFRRTRDRSHWEQIFKTEPLGCSC